MKTVSVIVLVVCLALAGCAAPRNSIRAQMQELDSAYARGELTANEYYARKNELIQARALLLGAIIQSDWTPKSTQAQPVYIYRGQSIR